MLIILIIDISVRTGAVGIRRYDNCDTVAVREGRAGGTKKSNTKSKLSLERLEEGEVKRDFLYFLLFWRRGSMTSI